MLCVLYVNAVGLCLGLAGTFIERILPAGAPRRWVWCLIIPVSFVLPGAYRFHHALPVGASQGAVVAVQNADDARPLAATLLGSQVWGQMESHNADVARMWNLASLVLLLWATANALRVALAINAARRKRASEGRPAVVDGISVVVTDEIGPATVGFWHSQVLVPRWVLALSPSQRQYVLRHEDEHRARYDAQLLFMASLLLILVPWNLAMWWQLRRLYLAVEIDCDNRVVDKLGNANAYGELLLKVAQAASRGPRLQPALLGGTGSLERRLTALLDPAPLRQIQRFLLPAFALGLLAVVLTVPHPVLKRTPHSHPTTVTHSAPTPR